MDTIQQQAIDQNLKKNLQKPQDSETFIHKRISCLTRMAI